MKRIALLKSRAGYGGGLEKASSRIAAAFIAKGDQVTLLTTGDSPPAVGGLEVRSTPTAPWPAFLRMEQYDQFVRKWLAAHPADIVFGMDRNRFQTHFRAGNGVHAAYLASRRFTEGRVKAALCYLNPLHQMILHLEKEALENPRLRRVFTNSHMVKQEILDRYEISPDKIAVLHNGVEWHEMAADFAAWPHKRRSLLEERLLPPDAYHLLFIGNGYLRKGLYPLLSALALLPNEEIFLSVVGKENRLPEYREKVRALKLDRRVRFFGPQHDIRPFYQYADALAIPSFYDPFANVTIEALAMGLFVVSSPHNGGSEILTPESGVVIPTLADPEAIASSLKAALSHRKSAASSLRIRTLAAPYDYSHHMEALLAACE
jgi:UDP-glucose:(heptosyl)LPS alpha-1,3-glucosyltransferase